MGNIKGEMKGKWNWLGEEIGGYNVWVVGGWNQEGKNG